MTIFHITPPSGNGTFWVAEDSQAARALVEREYGSASNATVVEVPTEPESYEFVRPINPKFIDKSEDGWLLLGDNGFLYYMSFGEVDGPYDEATGAVLIDDPTKTSRPRGLIVRLPTEEEEQRERQPPIMFTRPRGPRQASE